MALEMQPGPTFDIQGVQRGEKEIVQLLTPEVVANLENGREVIAQLPGLQAITDTIVENVSQERAAGERTRRVVVILGLTGIGKTTIAGQFHKDINTREEITQLRTQGEEFNTVYVNTGEIVRMLEAAGAIEFGQFGPDDMKTMERQALHVIEQFLDKDSNDDLLILELGLFPGVLGEAVIKLLEEKNAQGGNNFVELIIGDPAVQESTHEKYRATLYEPNAVEDIEALEELQKKHRMNTHGYTYPDLKKARTDQAPPLVKRKVNEMFARLLWEWSRNLDPRQQQVFNGFVMERAQNPDQLMAGEPPESHIRMAYEQAYWSIMFPSAVNNNVLVLDQNPKLAWCEKAEELDLFEVEVKLPRHKGQKQAKRKRVLLAVNIFKDELEKAMLPWRDSPNYSLLTRQELRDRYQGYSPDVPVTP